MSNVKFNFLIFVQLFNTYLKNGKSISQSDLLFFIQRENQGHYVKFITRSSINLNIKIWWFTLYVSKSKRNKAFENSQLSICAINQKTGTIVLPPLFQVQSSIYNFFLVKGSIYGCVCTFVTFYLFIHELCTLSDLICLKFRKFLIMQGSKQFVRIFLHNVRE